MTSQTINDTACENPILRPSPPINAKPRAAQWLASAAR